MVYLQLDIKKKIIFYSNLELLWIGIVTYRQ